MNIDPADWSCSFCGSRGTDATRFAGGLGAVMCTSCLEQFGAAFAAPENADQQVIGWADDALSDADLLARLPLVAAEAAQVDKYLRRSVACIRERRLSYAEIGKALGVSRQAAWERFSRPDSPSTRAEPAATAWDDDSRPQGDREASSEVSG
jgi:hypothetical protein